MASSRSAALLLLLASALQTTDCEVFSLSDNAYPYLRLMGESPPPVLWHTKGFALKMSECDAVRINSRGIRFIPPTLSVALVDGMGGGDRWKHYKCESTRDAMCTLVSDTPSGTGVTTRVFPVQNQPTYIIHADLEKATREGVPDFVTARCLEASTGRTATFAPKWDVSLCNVLGAGGDFVYKPYEGMLYVLQNPIPFEVFAVISVLTIIMAILLAHNLEWAMGSVKENSSTTLSVACMYALLFTTTFATGVADVLEPYITHEDRYSGTGAPTRPTTARNPSCTQ